ncbi:hypothetical protein ABIC28_000433 [Rhodococcus sp. PvR044]|uniref:hypothetical protein n=1 Tax=Rhodococcus sp. PvR044 TaxID=3156402 RepID=UPI003395471D
MWSYRGGGKNRVFGAVPLAGPGRWAQPYEGVTLYTNDSRILFLKIDGSDESRETRTQLIRALDKAFKAGQTAPEAFERLRNGAPVTTGDLSALA